MANTMTLNGVERSTTATAVRQKGAIPAVVYGHGVDPTSVEVDGKVFTNLLREAGYTSLISLKLGDKKEHTVLVREVQRHPVRSHIIHIDFYQVRLDEEIRANVPLLLEGEAPAVRDMGGVLVRQMDEVEVEALPQNLPHNIPVDMAMIDSFEKVIHVSDLKLPEDVVILNDKDNVIALVQAPKTQDEIDAELAEEVTEDVESVEGVEDKPEEGEEGAEGAEGDESAEGEAPATEEDQG